MRQSKINEKSAACYCRLSDDDEKDGMSVSIETQMKILGDYCRQHGFTEYSYYCDDGFSGTNFDRPDFRRMINDVEKGIIDTIIVKDLSRFGRNYVQVGTYMSEIFPAMGVRFIAVGDDVDSEKGNLDYDLMIPIKNVFNEYYPADCSRKTRQAFVSKAKNGEFIGSHAPYGYKKSARDKHVLEIDEFTAPTVRWIFRMAAYNGYGYNKIARVLTEKRIITPAAYQAQQAGREYVKDPYDWNLTTVFKMFENETYLGNLISGKRRKASFKSKKIIRQDEDKWIVVRGIFPQLIPDELWRDAHEKLGSRKRESSSGFDNIFAGLLKCADCGYALGIANASYRDNYFTCNTYRKKGPDRCSSHYIRYDELYDAVLEDIQLVLASVHNNKEEFVKRVFEKLNNGSDAEAKGAEQELETLEARNAELDRKFDLLYNDRLNGILSEKKFKELSEKCESEQERIQSRIDELRKRVSGSKDSELNVERFAEIAMRYENVETLDRELLNRLVHSIEVGERSKGENGAEQKITIRYRFVGEIL